MISKARGAVSRFLWKRRRAHRALVEIIGQTHHEGDGMRVTEVVTALPDSDEEKGIKTPSSDEGKAGAYRGYTEIETHPMPADVRRAFIWSSVIIIIISVLLPIPLGASTYIFSPGFLTAYLIVAMVRLDSIYTQQISY